MRNLVGNELLEIDFADFLAGLGDNKCGGTSPASIILPPDNCRISNGGCVSSSASSSAGDLESLDLDEFRGVGRRRTDDHQVNVSDVAGVNQPSASRHSRVADSLFRYPA